ncbi:MAG: tyrosine-type recombinase/integrase, partial [Gemmatimonadota bacterium]
INRELALIKQMLRLGYDEKLVTHLPKIEMLEEPPPREGFLRPGEFATLVARMAERHPEHVGWLEVAYWTGWRWRSTVLRLRWADVRDGWLYAPGLLTKNKKPVRRKLLGPLGDAVARQRAYVEQVQKQTGRVVPWMFCYPDGRPIKHPTDAFKNAAKAAGLPNLIMHDFCRSAWQNGVNAGIPEKDLMDAFGRRTRSIADRYNITDEARLAAVDEKLGQVAETARPERKVVNLTGEGRGK